MIVIFTLNDTYITLSLSPPPKKNVHYVYRHFHMYLVSRL